MKFSIQMPLIYHSSIDLAAINEDKINWQNTDDRNLQNETSIAFAATEIYHMEPEKLYHRYQDLQKFVGWQDGDAQFIQQKNNPCRNAVRGEHYCVERSAFHQRER